MPYIFTTFAAACFDTLEENQKLSTSTSHDLTQPTRFKPDSPSDVALSEFQEKIKNYLAKT